MEQHIQISLFKMKMFMKDGTITLGLSLQNIKKIGSIDLKEKPKDLARLMRFK